jgi:glycine/D-amino acid oxidase-like deaminating enzyme
VDIRVIGGGIVGAGVARDAAMRGLRVGLVEQHDSAFGTSSRSSRLLHGGLRYLAQGRLGLVHEASVEKKIIHYIAPHLAEPLPFIFPTYRGNRHWVLWQLKIGVKIYDLLCSGRNLGKSTWLSVAEVLRAVPGVNATGLKGASTRWRKRGETPRCARTERQVPDSGRLGFVAAFGGTEFQQSSIRSNMFIGDPQDTFQAPSGATWLGHKARAR